MDTFAHARQAAKERNLRLADLPLSPTGAQGRWVAGFLFTVREILARRQLLALLVGREIKSRYKDSVLGFAWGLVRPLTQLLVYYLVLGQFLGAARAIPKFAVFIFAGLTIYGLASEMLMLMTGAIVGNAGLVKKVYLPREIFPLAGMGSALFNFSLQMVVLLAACLLSGSLTLGWHLGYAIVGVALVIVYSLAFGLALSAINVYLRDVQYLVEVVVMLMMWASPIVYAWTFVGTAFADFGWPHWLVEVYVNNPLTLAVIGFQTAFWEPGLLPAVPGQGAAFAHPQHFGIRMLIALVIGILLVFVAQRVFARLQGNFAQEL